MTRPRKKTRRKRDSNPGPSALEADALSLGQRGGPQAKNVSLPGRGLETLAEEFNEFNASFDKHDFSSEISQVRTDLGKFVSDVFVFEEIEEESVREVFKRVNARIVVVCYFLSNILVCLRDGSAETVVRAAALR